MAKKLTESVEARLVRAGESIDESYSRRVFMQLAAAAGITGLGTTALYNPAIAQARGKIIMQVDVLHSYWVQWKVGFDLATEALGLDTADLYHGSDPARQLSQARSAKASGAQMFIGLPFPDGSVPQMARILNQAGVYYSNIWEHPAWFSPIDIGDYYVQYSTPNSVLAGYEVSKALFESIGGEGKVVHIWGLPTPTDAFRTAGVRQAASEYPGIELVGEVRTQWDRETGREAMLSMVTAHPDVKAVMAQNDGIAEGVLTVLRERGMDTVPVVGVDGLPDGLRILARGGQFIATHSVLPPYQAAHMVVTVFDALNGWQPSLPERMVYTQSVLVTPETAPRYLEVLYGEDGPQFDWTRMSKTLHPDDWDPQAEIVPIDPWTQFALFPENEDRLNPAYEEAKANGEFERVTQLYADHYKTGPFKS